MTDGTALVEHARRLRMYHTVLYYRAADWSGSVTSTYNPAVHPASFYRSTCTKKKKKNKAERLPLVEKPQRDGSDVTWRVRIECLRRSVSRNQTSLEELTLRYMASRTKHSLALD